VQQCEQWPQLPQLPQHGTQPISQVVSHFCTSYFSLSSERTSRTVPQRWGPHRQQALQQSQESQHSSVPPHLAQLHLAEWGCVSARRQLNSVSGEPPCSQGSVIAGTATFSHFTIQQDFSSSTKVVFGHATARPQQLAVAG
jgi:hypothetical protein